MIAVIVASIVYTTILLHFLFTNIPEKAGVSGRRWIMMAWVAGFCFAVIVKYLFNIP